MQIYPAIDILNGECVRLHKGAFDAVTVYNKDPIAMAESFKREGAEWLHVVDLEGAKDPSRRQTALIQKIIDKTGLHIQTGGGIRKEYDVAQLVHSGSSRVTIGSLAVKEPETVQSFFETFGPDKICLAADILRDSDGVWRIATSGWQETSTLSLDDFLNTYLGHGLQHVLCTDISRDGTMSGTNVELYEGIRKKWPVLKLQASGGIKNLADLHALKTAGVSGAIIGKALYEGAFTLKEALSC